MSQFTYLYTNTYLVMLVRDTLALRLLNGSTMVALESLEVALNRLYSWIISLLAVFNTFPRTYRTICIEGNTGDIELSLSKVKLAN